MKSTIPAPPGADTSVEARSATVTQALALKLRRDSRLFQEAVRSLSGEPAPGEAIPDFWARGVDDRLEG